MTDSKCGPYYGNDWKPLTKAVHISKQKQKMAQNSD
jgi:hypothetical protein